MGKAKDEDKPAGIEYVGMAGVTKPCVRAVERFLSYGDQFERVRLLTADRDHAFLLNWDEYAFVAVKTGFTSGYAGEGPHGLAYVLQLLEAHGFDVDEYDVPEDVMNRLDHSALTEHDLEVIEKLPTVRPSRIYDYMHERYERRHRENRLWTNFRPVIPFAIIEPRIMELALKFWENPDNHLLTAYRRLEDAVRTRTGLTEHGSKLFGQVFATSGPKLHWPSVDSREQAARSQLFTGTFGAFRNPRGHREPQDGPESLRELLAVNQLYWLEAQAQPLKADKK